jgi:hypothetical protein
VKAELTHEDAVAIRLMATDRRAASAFFQIMASAGNGRGMATALQRHSRACLGLKAMRARFSATRDVVEAEHGAERAETRGGYLSALETRDRAATRMSWADQELKELGWSID